MKCKHCNGTGTTNWCVNGTFVDCPYCGGTGEIEVEMTNEEWLRNATFEEMAGTLYERYSLGYTGGKNGVKMRSITEIVEWLRQPYKE